MNEFNYIIWRSFYNGTMTQEEKEQFLNSLYMPYKGYGNIKVSENDVDKAIELLKEYVGEYNFDDTYEKGFINSNHVSETFSYGKFHINPISEFLTILIDNNITIIDAGFFTTYC